MKTEQILAWMGSFLKGVRLSRVKTMAALVEALVKAEVVAITSIGREVIGVSKARYGIKRLDRFLANLGIETKRAIVLADREFGNSVQARCI